VSDLDLRTPRKPKRADTLSLAEVDHYSETWAGIAKPFAWFVFMLIAVVVVLPFGIVFVDGFRCGDRSSDLVERLLDWAKTVLAPIVGFGSAVVGYYFGTRSTTSARARVVEAPGLAEGEDQ
jgi:hypothetical protein